MLTKQRPIRNASRNCGSGRPGPLHPNEQARQLTGRDYLSYSAISTYQKCPLRYYFVYVAGLEPEFKSSSLVFGGVIHKAIEHHFNALFEGSDPPSLDALVGVFKEAWRSETGVPVRYGKGESEKSLRDLASRMLTAFQSSGVSQLDTSLLAVEEEFRGPVIEGCPDLLGRLDLVGLAEDHIRITDFKTARASWNPEAVRQATPQQMLYVELVKPLAAAFDLPIRIDWVVLTKTKNPAVEKHSLAPCPRRIAWTKSMVRRVWDAISAGHFYPSPSNMNCPSCPFRKTCDQWEGDL